MKYRFNDILNFLATYPCKTINQAANKLEISQPALSESLKRLEQDLGQVLFYRSRSGIELTSSGKVFLVKAQSLKEAYNNLDISENQKNHFDGRTITIGCHTTIAQYSIPSALAYLKAKAPDYKIELKNDISRTIQEGLQKGQIDVALVANPVEVPDLVIQQVGTDTIKVWSSDKTTNFDTIVCDLNLFQTHSILKHWENKPHKLLSVQNFGLICRIVNKGVGYGIITQRAVLLSGLNLYAQKKLPVHNDSICIIYRPEFGKNAAERLVIDALKQSVVKL
jgi:DNA-binding transcriptional LysR family regulator